MLNGFILQQLILEQKQSIPFQTKTARQIPFSALGAEECKMTMTLLRKKVPF